MLGAQLLVYHKNLKGTILLQLLKKFHAIYIIPFLKIHISIRIDVVEAQVIEWLCYKKTKERGSQYK